MRTSQSMHSHTHTQQQKTYLFWAPCTSLRSPNSHHQPWTHLWKKERSTFTQGIKRECNWPVYINTMENLLQKVLNKPTPPAQRSTPPQKSNAIVIVYLSANTPISWGQQSDISDYDHLWCGWLGRKHQFTHIPGEHLTKHRHLHFHVPLEPISNKASLPSLPSLFQNCPWKSSLMVLMTCTSIDTHLKTIQLLFKKSMTEAEC